MSLIHWDPFREMEQMMKRIPERMGALSVNDSFIPAIDMYEDGANIVIKTPLAGIDPNNVEVSVDNGTLTIKGEARTEHEIDEKNYYRKEIRSGSFFRQVALPSGVKEDEVNAEFADGVLKITAPKTGESKPKQVHVTVVKKN